MPEDSVCVSPDTDNAGDDDDWDAQTEIDHVTADDAGDDDDWSTQTRVDHVAVKFESSV